MPTERRHWIAYVVRIFVIALVLAAGIGVALFMVDSAPQPKKADPDRALQTVNVFAAQKAEVRRQWSGFGTAHPIDSADIPARVAAVVKNIEDDIQAGKHIRKDAPILQLDDTDFARQYDIATERLAETAAQVKTLAIEKRRLHERLLLEQEDLVLAQAELAKVQERVDKNAANVRELDQPKRSVLAAKRAIVLTNDAIERVPERLNVLDAMKRGLESSQKLAKLNVDRCKIISPIDGVIEEVDVERGENVTLGQRMIRVVNLNHIEVPLRLPASARQDLIVGSEVSLARPQTNPKVWKGKIARILPSDDQQTRSTVVLIEIKQPYANESFGKLGGRDLLTPGTFVTGSAESATTLTRWVVPRRSIINQRMWTVNGNLIKSIPVEREFLHEGEFPGIGLNDDQWAILTEDSALTEGMLIVVNASISVTDGQKVKPILPTASNAATLEPKPTQKPAPKTDESGTSATSSRKSGTSNEETSP